MLELRFIRENLELVKEKTAKRGLSLDKLIDFSTIDQERLTLLAEVEALKNKRNTVSKDIAALKNGSPEDIAKAEPMVLEMRKNSERIKELDNRLTEIQARLQEIVMAIPNLCDDSVPIGQ
ncbi:MAG: serine--tRNA ligase, partial [Proteobacteria bacterium]|nr:serine--tRNA ligase [Pseudomonadota bacterium]